MEPKKEIKNNGLGVNNHGTWEDKDRAQTGEVELDAPNGETYKVEYIGL